jgi:hypothetical protein
VDPYVIIFYYTTSNSGGVTGDKSTVATINQRPALKSKLESLCLLKRPLVLIFYFYELIAHVPKSVVFGITPAYLL